MDIKQQADACRKLRKPQCARKAPLPLAKKGERKNMHHSLRWMRAMASKQKHAWKEQARHCAGRNCPVKWCQQNSMHHSLPWMCHSRQIADQQSQMHAHG
jgi:hypothetical protein